MPASVGCELLGSNAIVERDTLTVSLVVAVAGGET